MSFHLIHFSFPLLFCILLPFPYSFLFRFSHIFRLFLKMASSLIPIGNISRQVPTAENYHQNEENDAGPGDCLGECLYFVVDIDRVVPLEYALPLYGFVMPILVLFTTAINSFIILVLSQRHLRTPTNFVLLSMALADLLTGLSSVPWFLFYYTFRGFELHGHEGLPTFWCRVHPLLSQIVPTIWHTAAIWLGVFLAVQRYIYVCVPSQVHRFCTPGKAKKAVASIILCSLLTAMPEMLGKRMERVNVGPSQNLCLLRYSAWVRNGLGVDLFFSLHYWFRVTLVHAMPCLLLFIFTLALTRTIKQAQLRRQSWITNGAPSGGLLEHQRSNPQHFASPCHINEQQQQQQQRAEMATATALEDNGEEEEDALNDNNKKQPNLLCPPTENTIGIGTLTLRKSASWCSNDAAAQLIQSNGASRGQTQTSSSGNGSSGGGRSLESTNRMLAAICSVFLLIELPAAFIFSLHLLIATGIAPNTPNTYRVLNVTLIIRNLLIVFTSPLQFGIYCSMSEQFRLTVRQLFSSRPLFVAQAQPSNYHGGKRYSLILVDLDHYRHQQQQQQVQIQLNSTPSPGSSSASPFRLPLSNCRRHFSLPQKGKIGSQFHQKKATPEPGQQQRGTEGERGTTERKCSVPAVGPQQSEQEQQE